MKKRIASKYSLLHLSWHERRYLRTGVGSCLSMFEKPGAPISFVGYV